MRKDDKKRKMDKRFQTSDERNSIFSSVQICSMFDPSVLTTPDLSNRVDANFSNHIIYVYCCKNERSSLDLENIVFLCQQTWKKFKPFYQGHLMKSTWFLLLWNINWLTRMWLTSNKFNLFKSIQHFKN